MFPARHDHLAAHRVRAHHRPWVLDLITPPLPPIGALKASCSASAREYARQSLQLLRPARRFSRAPTGPPRRAGCWARGCPRRCALRGGPFENALILEELAPGLALEPFLSCRSARSCDRGPRRRTTRGLLGSIIAGERIAGPAHCEAGAPGPSRLETASQRQCPAGSEGAKPSSSAAPRGPLLCRRAHGCQRGRLSVSLFFLEPAARRRAARYRASTPRVSDFSFDGSSSAPRPARRRNALSSIGWLWTTASSASAPSRWASWTPRCDDPRLLKTRKQFVGR